MRNPYRKHIVKKAEKQKERTKFAKLHFGETKKLLPTYLLRFCVKNKGKPAISKGDLLLFLLNGAVIYCKNYFSV